MKMLYPLLIFSFLFFNLTQCVADQQRPFKSPLSDIEQNELVTHTDEIYLYLGKDVSNIKRVITHICKLDKTSHSPVAGLKKHLDDGFVIALCDAVVETLEYAYQFISHHRSVASSDIQKLKKEIAALLKKIKKGRLTINNSATMPLTREIPLVTTKKKKKKCRDTSVIKGNLHVRCNEKVKGKLFVQGHTDFSRDLSCKKDLILKDSLYMQNSKNHKIGNVFKKCRRFIHNFGVNNTFVGVNAGNFKMHGESNSGFGIRTLTDNRWGEDNTAVGAFALTFNTDGKSDTAIGTRSLQSNTTGNYNVGCGADTLRSNSSGQGNTAVGNKALMLNNGINNTSVGRDSLTSNTTGEANVADGSFALNSNTVGNFNVAVGPQAMQYNVSGNHNVAMGSCALNSNMTGIDNVAIGGHALFSNTVNGCVAVGNRALTANTTGDNNVAMGRNALTSNTNGDSNTVMGNFAMEENTVGRLNVAIGRSAMRNCTTGSSNIAIGQGSGQNLTTGNNNIYFDNEGIANEHNAIRIGTIGRQNKCFVQGIYQNQFSSTQADVQVEIGTGKLGVTTSSAQHKENIEDLLPRYSKNVHTLRPVTFNYKNDALHTKNIGLIAEEVAELYPEIVVYDAEGKPISICYKLLSVLLLSELQHMHGEIENMHELVAKLEKAIKASKKVNS